MSLSSIQASVPAMRASPGTRRNPLTRSVAGMLGLSVLGLMLIVCIGSMWWTLGERSADEIAGRAASVRYDDQDRLARHIPPTWSWSGLDDPNNLKSDTYQRRIQDVATREVLIRIAHAESSADHQVTLEQLEAAGIQPRREQIHAARPTYLLGTDLLGRSLLIRCLAGGGISLSIGISAALISVFLGTFYGSIAGYVGGRLDAVMMRIVDILYGLPYILLVVLFAVAIGAVLENQQISRAKSAREDRAAWIHDQQTKLPPERAQDPQVLAEIKTQALDRFREDIPQGRVIFINVLTLLLAIGGVSWLTMARVVRGQVLSLKEQPFMEAARAMGVPVSGIFIRHLLPNLIGPIVVYATLTVPQAILQESFLSFLGIGVKSPMPSWGSLAADGLTELNPFKCNWWLITFPCLLLAITLLSLNFVGEGLREALDPKRRR